MKRIALLVFAGTIAALAAHAEYTGPAAAPVITTVAAAQKADDDAQVLLEGSITRRLSHEHYEFQDATGTIHVEIDDKLLPAQKFDQKSVVRLGGQVDRDRNSREIDVKRFDILR